MTTKDRIAEIESMSYHTATYEDLIWAIDKLKDERKRSARFITEARAQREKGGKYTGFLMVHGCFGPLTFHSMEATDDHKR